MERAQIVGMLIPCANSLRERGRFLIHFVICGKQSFALLPLKSIMLTEKFCCVGLAGFDVGEFLVFLAR
jgi:hypothetical protein